mmetsp:Transcript_6902/g.10360  ORF Transcript_6902/g.10360 Transcript_6902/m.10360 type:complete len:258 (-) Transcript_6902:2867-3640(-)
MRKFFALGADTSSLLLPLGADWGADSPWCARGRLRLELAAAAALALSRSPFLLAGPVSDFFPPFPPTLSSVFLLAAPPSDFFEEEAPLLVFSRAFLDVVSVFVESSAGFLTVGAGAGRFFSFTSSSSHIALRFFKIAPRLLAMIFRSSRSPFSMLSMQDMISFPAVVLDGNCSATFDKNTNAERMCIYSTLFRQDTTVLHNLLCHILQTFRNSSCDALLSTFFAPNVFSIPHLERASFAYADLLAIHLLQFSKRSLT